ncbi:sigma-70 family RNA polymerase sigma factor [Pedobacter petrophilus]|uniref:Sigma-70 family RNA polymerase sigma factor n=1 Tax=Pedobacter petrophilus TaxID=1908241 RepID=A0A7K0G4D2_9SPHI|nr:sigma-70 family RNA polymerase sigma factor [Pedobacter petrophilus]MRX77826.1 sigma-70 family RNA polymerase sigma factor [Pedobacter petrophilus]
MIAFILTQSSTRIISVLNQDHSEKALLAGLRAESVPAFNKLYKMYAANLFGVIMKIINQQETSEDVLQEVFIKIKKGLPGYDEKRSRLFTWMMNITKHAAIDHTRLKSSRTQATSVRIEDVSGELNNHSYSYNTDTIGLKKLVNNLNKKQRNILDLAYYKGYTHEEIAGLLLMPLGSVKSSIRQAIIRLRVDFEIS